MEVETRNKDQILQKWKREFALTPWTRAQAEEFVKGLAKKVSPFKLEIVGGVLTQGHSDHDLDILVKGRGDFVRLGIFFKRLKRIFPKTKFYPFGEWNGVESIAFRLSDGKLVDFFAGTES